MFTPITTPTPSFPPVDAALKALASIDYKKQAIRALLLLATVAAIIVGASQFIYRNARKFWAKHGDDIQIYFFEFINWLEITIETVHKAGMDFRPVANRFVAMIADRAYYYLTEVA